MQLCRVLKILNCITMQKHWSIWERPWSLESKSKKLEKVLQKKYGNGYVKGATGLIEINRLAFSYITIESKHIPDCNRSMSGINCN